MFTVKTRDDALESLELRDEAATTRAILAPSRGGMVTRWSVRGREILFLDEATLRDPKANVRGGNPVLFPTPGKLEGDAWSRDGKSGALKQHGFARNLAWNVASTSADGAARATLTIESNDDTRKNYPWDFRASYTYSILGSSLRIEMKFENAGSTPMPFGAGFHPYFAVPQNEKAAARIDTPATRAFDNVTKAIAPFSAGALDLTAKEIDLHLIDHGAKPCTLAIPGKNVRISASPEFARWVLWTLAGKDFICVEPWTCPGNAMNTGEHLLILEKGATRTLVVELECTDTP